jgi:hypothetical protein
MSKIIDTTALNAFVTESNMIEGISRPPTPDEVQATLVVLHAPVIDIETMAVYVESVQPGARIRNKLGMNVQVGNHIPPKGGEHITYQLVSLLTEVNDNLQHPYKLHNQYETLHPFMDGNGRSGRVIWLWQMLQTSNRLPPLGFLHSWYYQTLQHGGI